MATESAGTVGKALSVPTLLGKHPNGVTATRIAEEVDYPFSTVHLLLNSLVRSECATYDPREKKHRLGPQCRTTTGPGDHGTLHASAAGKALLAFSDRAGREHRPDTIGLMPRTELSVTDRDELRRQVEQIRAQGRVCQQEEHDIGMAALAVPAPSPSKGLIAALTLAAPLFRTDLARLQRYVLALQQAAPDLALELPPQP